MMSDLAITRRRAVSGLTAMLLPGFAAQSARAAGYSEISYRSGSLNISGYLYRPVGSGPFPAIVYNHGSRLGLERNIVPWVRLAGLYVEAGYAVLVPERRGYGRSDGPTWSQAVGRDVGSVFLDRLVAETGDVLAAADFLTTVPFIDHNRLGIVGWSLGGIVTMFAIARSRAFRTAINQAGGVLTWRSSPALQSALGEAARGANCPALLMDAANDAAPEAMPALAQAMTSAGRPNRLAMYPAFTPTMPTGSNAPGHALFSAEGIPIWSRDALTFLGTYLRP